VPVGGRHPAAGAAMPMRTRDSASPGRAGRFNKPDVSAPVRPVPASYQMGER